MTRTNAMKKSYINWLKLMVIHFDAVYVLLDYITGPSFNNQRICLKILVAPPTDEALLPWRQLFTDSKLFPAVDPRATTNNAITNDEILKFLNDAASPDMTQCFSLINAVRRCWKQEDKDSTIKHLAKFISSHSETSDWHRNVGKLAATINDYYANDNITNKIELFDSITNTIQSLHDAAIFYLFLSKKDFSKTFSGTLHCEACLTSLLSPHLGNDITIDSKHKDVLEQMKVRYVVSGWFYQQLIISDDRIMDELLAYQNVAARRVDTFSRS